MVVTTSKNIAEMSLHEIRCFIQRQRMGVAESSARQDTSASNMTEEAVDFIQKHFTIKECMRYVADKENTENLTDVCCCGQKQTHHPGQNYDEESGKWDERKDILTYSGTNAFGSIIFRDEHSGARKPSKFLRVGCHVQVPNFLDSVPSRNCEEMLAVIERDTWATVDNTLHFLKDSWQLFNPLPNLAVAIIGGAKQFKLDNKRVETFSRGLIKVAISTHAWILSGGCNFGIMKIVGDCVREGQTMDADTDDDVDVVSRIRCIGISHWGYVKDRENLVIRAKLGISNRRPQTAYGQRSTGQFSSGVSIAVGQPQQPDEIIPHGNLVRAYNEPVRMYTSIKSGKSEGYLNPDHSHFLFVDNGLRNHKCIHDSLFMTCLLHRLNCNDVFKGEELPPDVKTGDYAIPSVVIVVEGGLAVIDTVFFAVHINIPVVICSHTGRAADIFSAAVEIMLDIKSAMPNPDMDPPIPTSKDYHFSAIHKKVAKAFFKDENPETVKDKVDQITRRVFETAAKTQLITLFDLTAREDFDSAILSALLKVDRTDKKTDNALDQLNLALTWDRADIAEEKIFPYYPEDETGRKNLEEVMKSALLKTKLGFVTLLINRGFSIKEFLTVELLASLYKSTVEKDKYLSPLFQAFKRSHSGRFREISKKNEEETVEMIGYWNFLADVLPFYKPSSFDDKHRLANPYIELFLWSVLLNRVEMATYFWQKIDHPIIAALLAALMSKSLAERASDQDSEFADGYNEAKVEFERLATDLINKCALIDSHMSVITLERIHPQWGRTTCLQAAALADCKKFVGSAVCQDVLNQRWQRKIVSSWPFICLGIIFAPLIPLIVQFDFGDSPNMAISRKLSRLFDLYRNSSQVEDISIAAKKAIERRNDAKNNKAASFQDNLQKYSRFFKAPVTKFCFTTITSCLFLILYTYVLIFSYHDPSLGYNRPFEYLLHAWVFTLLCEAVHEIFRFPVDSFERKVSFWWRSIWNKAEASAIFFYIIAFILRFSTTPDNLEVNFAAKVFFAFALFIFFVKLLRVLNASTTLGPQLVMIGNMLMELVPFLVLILTCLMSFGVAHAAFYHEEALSVVYDNFKFIVTYSFWSLMSGPDLSEIFKADIQEGGDAQTAAILLYCQDNNSTGCPSSSNNSSDTNSTEGVNFTTPSFQLTTATAAITTLTAVNSSFEEFVNNSVLVGNNSAVMTFPTAATDAMDDGDFRTMAGSWFLSAFLAFWILLSFLLVNLLIAIFSNVYNEVNQNSNEIWKYYQYQMITEFESKQALPPPLSFIGLGLRLIRRLIRLLVARCRRGFCQQRSQFGNEISKNGATILITPPDSNSNNSENAHVEDGNQDPALNFEHETRAAMIRDKKRKQRHGGVVNQLTDIHKQLAQIRDQVARLGRLETIAEAAVVEADKVENVKTEPVEEKPPILSAKKARSRIVPSPAFNTPKQNDGENVSALESRVEKLTNRMEKFQQLGEKLILAIKMKQEIVEKSEPRVKLTSEEGVKVHFSEPPVFNIPPPAPAVSQPVAEKMEEFSNNFPPVEEPIVPHLPPPPPLPSRQNIFRSQPPPPPSPPFVLSEPSRQLVLPVAGIGLASVPRPAVLRQGGLYPQQYWPFDNDNNSDSASQVILDWPGYSQITRRQTSPRDSQ